LHLWHGFWSAFQTLGLNHRRYTPVIRAIGMVYSVGMAVGFSAIPVLMYLNR
jgi:succinate dehydrogenase / fumarate reductase cytochrome b subunit